MFRGNDTGGCKATTSFLIKREELKNLMITEDAGKRRPRG